MERKCHAVIRSHHNGNRLVCKGGSHRALAEIALKVLEAGQHVIGTVRNHSKAAKRVVAMGQKVE